MADTSKQAQWRILSGICLAAAGLFLLTALVLTFNSGIDLRKELPGEGGDIGPFTIAEPWTVLEIEVFHPVVDNHWSFVTGSLLSADGSYLIGFGDELWYASGYDSGRWVETDYRYDTKLTVREAGTYTLHFDTESDVDPSSLRPMTVTVEEKLGSVIPHLVAGILLIIAGIVLNLRNGGTLQRVFQEASGT